jgi:hypothetical protein
MSQLLIDEQYKERTANREQYNTNELAWKPQLRFRSHTTQRRAVCSCRSVLDAPRMDPQSWPAEPQDYKQKTRRTCVHRSEQQDGLESHKTAIKLHRSAQQNKTQECDGGHCVLVCRSQEWWQLMVIPVVETSGSQECVGGTCKFL